MGKAGVPADPRAARMAPPAPDGAAPTDRTVATATLVLQIAAQSPRERELGGVLREALDGLGTLVGFDGAGVRLLAHDALVLRAALGAIAQTTDPGPDPGGGLSGEVLRSGRPVSVPDLGAKRPLRSWLGVPILRFGTSVGLLELARRAPGGFTADEEEVAVAVGRALAAPVDMAARAAEERRSNELRDAFIGIVSHELRTPITTIFGMSQVLRQRHATMAPEDQRQVIADIEAEADRLRRLAEDLLVLSRSERGQLNVTHDPLLLGHVVRRRLAAEALRWPGHRFSAVIPPGLPLVVGEEVYLEQVVQNLLGNAAKYSPAGSEITVVVEQGEDELLVHVLDEGIGLGNQSPEQLFELFYRSPLATRRASGAGIGLFVCRQLIEAMGGRIQAAPREPRGAVFTFSLPVHPEVEPLDDD